jgi:gluconate 2-dehydrogenase gamma chain
MKTKMHTLTRRRFVAISAMAGAAMIAGCTSRKRDGWEFLTEEDARTLAAICDQIVPADEYPSASQAGVVVYIDRQLVRHYRRYQEAYRDGLERADRLSRIKFSRSLLEVATSEQATVVNTLEKQDRRFFELVRSHTLEGYYGSPRHGGNRDAVSWRMLGLAEPPLRGQSQHDLRKKPRS